MASMLPLLVAAFLAVQPKVQRDGWGSLMPTTTLILAVNLKQNTWALDELHERVPRIGTRVVFASDEDFAPYRGHIWPWQWRWLGAACARAAMDRSRPVDERLHSVYWVAHISQLLQEPYDGRSRSTLRELLHDESIDVRTTVVAFILRASDLDRSVSDIVPLLTDPETRVRSSAYTALWSAARFGDPIVLPYLFDGMTDDDVNVRALAHSGLSLSARSTTWPREYVRSVTERLLGDANPMIGGSFKGVRTALGADYDEQDMWMALQSANSTTRAGAFRTLSGYLPDQPPLPWWLIDAIVLGLGDEDEHVRWIVLDVYRRLHESDAALVQEELRLIGANGNERVVAAVRRAKTLIGNE